MSAGSKFVTLPKSDVLADKVAVFVAVEFEDGITARVQFEGGASLTLMWNEGWRVLSCDIPMWTESYHEPHVLAAHLAQWTAQASRNRRVNLSVVFA